MATASEARWYNKFFIQPLLNPDLPTQMVATMEWHPILLSGIRQFAEEKPDSRRAIQISMATESYENPIAERINGILKDELLRPGYPNYELAKADIQKAIRIYNEKRPHRSLNMMMPTEAHNLTGLIPKRWKKNKYRDKTSYQKSTTGEKKKMVLTYS